MLPVCDTFMDTNETQRGIQKGSGGRSQVLSWNKIKPEQELCFLGLVV